jgi:hypothetical protein
VLGLGAGLLCEVWPNPTLIRLHPMRASWVAWLALGPGIGVAAAALWRRERTYDRDLAAMIVFGATLSVFGRVPHLLVLAPALWACALDRHRRAAALAGPALALAVPALVLWSKSLALSVVPFWEGAIVIDGGLTFAATCSLAVAASIEVPRRRVLLAGAGAAGVVSVAHLLFVLLLQVRGPAVDYVDVQRWLAAHRPAGEVVLVPLARIGLRAFSNQTPALDFEDGLASFHDPGYVPVLEEKLAAYGWQPGATVHGFSFLEHLQELDRALTADDVRRIAARLHATIAVRDKSMPRLELPVLYENQRFAIVDAAPPPR